MTHAELTATMPRGELATWMALDALREAEHAQATKADK